MLDSERYQILNPRISLFCFKLSGFSVLLRNMNVDHFCVCDVKPTRWRRHHSPQKSPVIFVNSGPSVGMIPTA
jgi:hypothetical protein